YHPRRLRARLHRRGHAESARGRHVPVHGEQRAAGRARPATLAAAARAGRAGLTGTMGVMHESLHTRPSDPFGVRVATATVVAESHDVSIDDEAIERVARHLAGDAGESPAWDDRLHYRGQ